MPSKKRRCDTSGKRKENMNSQKHAIGSAQGLLQTHPLETEAVIARVLEYLPMKYLLVARQLNKKWNRETLLLFRRRRSPVVTLTLDKDKLVVGNVYMTTSLDKDPLLLNLKSMVGVEKNKPVPTFSLIITPGMIQSGSRQGFVKLIRDHGSSLVELKLTLSSEEAKNWFPVETQLSLLKKLHLCFTKRVASINEFVEPLLKACTNLDALTVLEAWKHPVSGGTFSWLPSDISNLLLPEALSVLDISRDGLKSSYIGVLAKTPLKNLKVLKFRLHNEEYEQDIILRILENVCKTLEEIDVSGVIHGGRGVVPLYVRFPHMKSLQFISLCAPQLELAGNGQNLCLALPKLETLSLQNIKLSALRKWVGTSELETITYLNPAPVNQQVPETHPHYLCSVPGEMISQIHANFPNLHTLVLNQDQNDWSGLNSVFLELRHLQALCLDISYSGSNDPLTATLLGIPVQLATIMREGFKELTLHNQDLPSIANMHSLSTLHILKHPSAVSYQSEPDAVIPDHVFNQALFKMPRLTSIIIGKNFSVSAEIQKMLNANSCTLPMLGFQ